MSVDVSVIICCYNSEQRLPKTLEYLSNQNVRGVNWEVVLVDNNSKDNTTKVAYSEWNKLGAVVSLLVVKENIPGLSFARKKGIESSRGNILVFCDDDNWLDSNYINHIHSLFKNKSYRIIGGWGLPISDIPFPNWFSQLEGYGYAVGKQGRRTGKGYAVHGAGMAIKRIDGLSLLDKRFIPLLSDRKGKKLSTGGDAEISILIGGENRFFDEALIYYHYLPENRLTWEYFIKLNYYVGVADSYLYFYKIGKDDPILALKKYLYRIFSSVKILICSVKRNYFNDPTFQDKIDLIYYKGYLIQITLNLFTFKKHLEQAKRNLVVFS